MADGKSRAMLAVVILTTLFTGMSGLVYEVTWQKYLSNFLGSQAQATALILAVFLGGLAAGYLLFGRLSRGKRPVALLRMAALAEALIGLWALMFPAFYQALWDVTGVLGADSAWRWPAEIGVAAALVGFPTVLMGSTLPLLTQGLTTALSEAPRVHAAIYAVNTGGAFIGCLAAGFILLPVFGLPLTLMCTSPVNIVAGAVIYLVSRRFADGAATDAGTTAARRREDAPGEKAPLLEDGAMRPWVATVLAFMAGYVSLSFQTLLIRVVGLTLGSSEYAFSMVVAVFVLMLAAGAAVVSRSNVQRPVSWLLANQSVMVLSLLALFLCVDQGSYWGHRLRILFSASNDAFYAYYAAVFLALALLLAVPIGAMGCCMPLLFAVVRRSIGGLGANVGRLYGANTIGCVLGALLGGYWSLSWLELDGVYRMTMLFALSSAAIVLGSQPRVSKSWTARLAAPALAVAIGAAAVILAPGWDRNLLDKGFFRIRQETPDSYLGIKAIRKQVRLMKQVFHDDDPNTSVAVLEIPGDLKPRTNPDPVSWSLLVNAKSDGQTSSIDWVTTKLLAHLPALLSGGSGRLAAVVGFGTGITAGTLAMYPDIKRVDVIEIAPAVREAAPIFDPANYNASKNPKIKWWINDAYRILGSSTERYAIVSSEPSNPWVCGVEKVYAQEFYRLAAARLDEGGIYAQWFHNYSVSEETFSTVYRTFSSVFPHVRVFDLGRDSILLGSLSALGPGNVAAARGRWNFPVVRGDFRQINVDNTWQVWVSEVPALPEVFAGGGIHSLEFPKLSYMAGRDFFHERKFSLGEFAVKPMSRPLMKPFFRESLSALEMSNPPPGMDADRMLDDWVKTSCKIENAGFFAGWTESHERCIQGLVALAKRRGGTAVQAADQAAAGMLEMVHVLEGSKPLEVPAGYEKAVKYRGGLLAFYVDMNSEVLPIRAAVTKIREIGMPCVRANGADAEGCTISYLNSLVVAGASHEALKLIDSIQAKQGREVLAGVNLAVFREQIAVLVGDEKRQDYPK
jgi:predicted membrane-bound spermidine synthase